MICVKAADGHIAGPTVSVFLGWTAVWLFFFFLSFVFLSVVVVVAVVAISWAAPAAYGGSQARG